MSSQAKKQNPINGPQANSLHGQELLQSQDSKVNRRILVVEDEVEIAKAYQMILTPEQISNIVPIRKSSRVQNQEAKFLPSTQIPPYELVVAHSGEQALQFAKDSFQQGRPFSMGFIDVLLGKGIDGIELVKQISSFDPNMYFVFVTAYQDRSVDTINEHLGPTIAERWDYLTKPFSDGEILQKARSCVTHWNLQTERAERDHQLLELQRRLFDSERYASAAATFRGMGHEFGNILVQIMGRAELSKRKPEADMQKAFDQIIHAGELAAKVLDRFRKLAKNSTSDTPETLIRLTQPIEDALLLMDYQLKATETSIDFIRKESALAIASSSSLTQVIVNILINSMHAMGAKGKVELSVIKGADHNSIVIRDLGPGVPTEILPRVCETFFTTKGEAGTGLGLSICKEIVEIEHAGVFLCRNHPDGGFEIEMQFPPTQKEGK